MAWWQEGKDAPLSHFPAMAWWQEGKDAPLSRFPVMAWWQEGKDAPLSRFPLMAWQQEGSWGLRGLVSKAVTGPGNPFLAPVGRSGAGT